MINRALLNKNKSHQKVKLDANDGRSISVKVQDIEMDYTTDDEMANTKADQTWDDQASHTYQA